MSQGVDALSIQKTLCLWKENNQLGRRAKKSHGELSSSSAVRTGAQLAKDVILPKDQQDHIEMSYCFFPAEGV